MPDEKSKQPSAVEQLNRWPLNKLAEQSLDLLSQDCDPSSLYSLQLVQWVLDQRPEVTQVPEDLVPELLSSAWKMVEWDPLAAQTLLLNVPDKSQEESEVKAVADRLAKDLEKSSRLPETLGSEL